MSRSAQDWEDYNNVPLNGGEDSDLSPWDADYQHTANCNCIACQPPEPYIDDTVRCCPDCERPNQFGELCEACRRESGEGNG